MQYSAEADKLEIVAENTRLELLADARRHAENYVTGKDRESWPQTLCDADFGCEMAECLVLAHTMLGTAAAAQELLRQHLVTERMVDAAIQYAEDYASDTAAKIDLEKIYAKQRD